MQVSLKTLDDMQNKIQSARARAANLKKSAQATAMVLVGAGEIAATSFGLGVVNGRWSNPELVGVPVDLGLGVSMHMLGFLVGGAGSEHMHNLGNGAVACYLSGLGTGVGRKMLDDTQAKALAPD